MISLLFIVIASGLYTNGFEFRFTKAENEAFQSVYMETDSRNCLGADRDSSRGLLERCIYGGKGPLVLLIGDSHANHLNEMILNLRNDNGEIPRVAEFTQSACAPILDLAYTATNRVEHAKACYEKNQKTLDIINKIKPDLILLSARWPRNEYVNILHGGYLQQEPISVFSVKFEKMVREILSLNIKLYIFNDIAGSGEAGYLCQVKNILKNDNRSCDIVLPSYDTWFIELNERLSKELQFKFININDYICNSGKCHTVLKGIPMYRDEGHLNRISSKNLSTIISNEIELN